MTELNFITEGNPSGPALVLAHGLATDCEMWADAAGHLGEYFRIIRYDSRGHGRTPAGADGFTLEDLAQDVIRLLDILQIESAAFAGLSMGGMVGMTLALSGSDRISSLIVCNARGDAPEAYRNSWDDRIAKVRADGVAAIADATINRWFTSEFLGDPAKVAKVREMMLRTSVDGYCFSAAALKALNCTPRLPSMSIPAMFLTGAEDVGAPVETMREMHRLTPGSRFEVISGAGHISALEQPLKVAEAILSFHKEL